MEELKLSRINSNRLILTKNPYFIIRPQKLGEDDLHYLAANAEEENYWLYYHDVGYWLHPEQKPVTRLDVKRNKRKMGVRSKLPHCPNFGNNITHYHIHPDYSVDYYFDEEGNPKLENALFTYEELKQSLVFPSTDDFIFHTKALEDMNLQCKIVTSLGITTYGSLSQDVKHIDMVEVMTTLLEETKDRSLEDKINIFNQAVEGYAWMSFEPYKGLNFGYRALDWFLKAMK